MWVSWHCHYSVEQGAPGFGQIYSHHSWLEAVAGCMLIHHHAARGKRFGAVLEAAGTRHVDRPWKRSKVF